jgi:hypothetical protein
MKTTLPCLLLLGALLGCTSEPPPTIRAEPPLPPMPRARPASTPTQEKKPNLNISEGTIPLGDIRLRLELGKFTIQKLNDLLQESQQEGRDAPARVSFFMEQLKRIPFEYESQLPIPEKNVLRIRLASFGCTGFVIYLLALANASTFEEFAQNVRVLRYWQTETRGVDSDPTDGNIMDFAYNIFAVNAVERGFLKNVTQEVAGEYRLTTFKTRFTARRRTEEYDKENRLVVPKINHNKVVKAKMISDELFYYMDRSKIQTGDVFLFSRIDPEAPIGEELMVSHLGVALNVDGEIYLMHATRDYVWRPDATQDTPPSTTGIYYAQDPRREQLGVSIATVWVNDYEGRQIKIDDKLYFGYHQTKLRPLHNYMTGAKITGVMVLRPIERATQL